MLLAEIRTELAHYASKMYESGLVRATQGNLSARDTVSSLICITPSGADYQTLTAEDIVVVSKDAHVIEGKWRPSVETPLHTHILDCRPDINCVMHTHSIYASACAVVYQRIPVILAESASCLGAEIPITPYQISGTPAFAKLVAKTLGDGAAVLWGNHGAMVVGTTLALTFSTAHALEDTAKVYSIARQIGTPVELSADDIAALRAHWQKGYRQTALEVDERTHT